MLPETDSRKSPDIHGLTAKCRTALRNLDAEIEIHTRSREVSFARLPDISRMHLPRMQALRNDEVAKISRLSARLDRLTALRKDILRTMQNAEETGATDIPPGLDDDIRSFSHRQEDNVAV